MVKIPAAGWRLRDTHLDFIQQGSGHAQCRRPGYGTYTIHMQRGVHNLVVRIESGGQLEVSTS